jgi:hypothetical protein
LGNELLMLIRQMFSHHSPSLLLHALLLVTKAIVNSTFARVKGKTQGVNHPAFVMG